MMHTDLIIIGSGAAGLSAAVSALEKGIHVTLLEKSKKIGGISVTGMGIFAVESKYQKEKNVNFTKDDAFNHFMEATQWKADPRLVREYVDLSASTIDWLEDMGVKFALLDKLTYPGAINQTGHLIIHPTIGIGAGATSAMITALNTRALQLGCNIITEASVLSISKHEKEYTVTYKKDDIETSLSCAAVCIGSGGYVHDEKMLHDTGKPYGQDIVYKKSYGLGNNIPLTGECIKMAYKLGAVPDGMALMGTTYMDGMKFFRTPETQPLWDFLMFCFPYLWVNKQGNRFVNEGNLNGCYMSNAVARQKDGQYFMIFDQALVDRIKNEGPDVYGYLTADSKINIGALFELIISKGADNYYIADSISELAEKTSLPENNLKATIKEYNEACADRHDPLFAKNPKYLRPISTPKYYAVKRMNAGYGSVGGIKIDHKARVINGEFDPIPGLYAAGDCANGLISYNTSLMYSVWGGTLSFAVNSGRIAGMNSADYIINNVL